MTFCDNANCVCLLPDNVVHCQCSRALYCCETCRLEALDLGHLENCHKMRGQQQYSDIGNTHDKLLKIVETLFENDDFAGVVALTPRIKEMADFFVVTSDDDHSDVHMRHAVVIFSQLADANECILNTESATHFYSIAWKLQQSVPATDNKFDTKTKVIVGENLARCYRRNGQPEEAMKLYLKCCRLCVDQHDEKCWIFGELGRCAVDMGLYDSAIMWVDKAESLLGSFELHDIEEETRADQCIGHLGIRAQCKMAVHQYADALAYLQERAGLIVVTENDDTVFSLSHINTLIMTAKALSASASSVVNSNIAQSEEIFRAALVHCTPEYAIDDLRDKAKLQSMRNDIELHLSFVLFKQGETRGALEVLRGALQKLLHALDCVCGYCKQHKDQQSLPMLLCGGCRAVRFCGRKHQEMASARLGMLNGKFVVPHNRLCRILKDFRLRSLSRAQITDEESERAQLAFLEKGQMTN